MQFRALVSAREMQFRALVSAIENLLTALEGCHISQ